MTDDQQQLSDALRDVSDLREELASAHHEQLAGAERRARLHVDELLTSAIDIAGLDDSGRSELDIALELVRSRAEEVGLLQRKPPRPVS